MTRAWWVMAAALAAAFAAGIVTASAAHADSNEDSTDQAVCTALDLGQSPADINARLRQGNPQYPTWRHSPLVDSWKC
jgi:hypothetical protein